jgi:hypothetical protein
MARQADTLADPADVRPRSVAVALARHNIAGVLSLLPILLPSHRTTADKHRQMWNVGPAHDRRRTVLDDSPMPTGQLPLVPAGAAPYRLVNAT